MVQGTPMKPKGKPKFPPTVAERETIVTLAASGASQNAISKSVGRSRHLVRNVLAEPEVQKAVGDEKQELAEIFRQKSRDVVTSISDTDISKASLQQKSISSGVLLDKSLLLAGEPTTNINVQVLLDVAGLIRRKRDEADEEAQRAWQAQHTLPAVAQTQRTLSPVPQTEQPASRPIPTPTPAPVLAKKPAEAPAPGTNQSAAPTDGVRVRIKYYTPVPVEPSEDDTNPLFHGLRKQP